MKEVYTKVLIGDRHDGLRCLNSKEDVGYILTIDTQPLENNQNTCIVKHIRCLDEPEADLLSHMNDCVAFIQEGVEKSKVLVHCFAGVSRSATVVLAYIMKTEGISLEKALELLKECYPVANPNPGFIYQLKLYKAMGNMVDQSSPLYKQFRLQIMANNVEQFGFGELSKEKLAKLTKTSTMTTVVKEKSYKCRKCRCLLFKSGNCLQHVPGSGQEFLPWYKKSLVQPGNDQDKSECTSYFIEPIHWMMESLLGTLQGKITCPKCSGRLGSFNWAGEQCSCGRWITPAFQIHKSRIDEK